MYTRFTCIVQDLKRSVRSLESRIHKLRREALTLVRQNELLRNRFELLISIPGIAQVSAMQLLAELSTLPSDLTVREWSLIAVLIRRMKFQEAQ
jgi:transposase